MGPLWRRSAFSMALSRTSTCTWTRASPSPATRRARRPLRSVSRLDPLVVLCWVSRRAVCWRSVPCAGPDGPEQLRAEQHDDLRGVAGGVGGAADPAAPGVGRRRRVARRPEGRLGRVRGAVARLARPARHAVLAQLLPAARPARRRVYLRREGDLYRCICPCRSGFGPNFVSVAVARKCRLGHSWGANFLWLA